jgi:hypothetical protein
MYDNSTLVSEVLRNEELAIRRRADKAGLSCDDPASLCCGIVWARDFVSKQPLSTIPDLIYAFKNEKEGDVAAWASGLLCNQWDAIHDEFKDFLIGIMDGDNCLRVAKEIGSKIDRGRKGILRTGFIKRHNDPSQFDKQ